LEPAAFERIAKRLTRVTLRPKDVVYKPDQRIDHVLFPENSVPCLMTLMSNGDTIEAATVGREGASIPRPVVGSETTFLSLPALGHTRRLLTVPSKPGKSRRLLQ
jgi:hypothetical protein